MWKFLRVNVPVAQPRVVVLALAEPSIIHDETLYPDACGFLGKCHLPGLVHIEAGGLPGVVEHGPQLRTRRARQQGIDFKPVQQARCAADAVARIAAVKVWRLEVFALLQPVAEIEAVRPSADAHLLQQVLLDSNLPGPAPAERTEPYAAMFGIEVSVVVNCKPGIVLRAGRAAAALKDGLARLHGLFLQIPLPSPATREIAQPIIGAAGQIPRCSGDLLDDEWSVRSVLNIRRTSQHARFSICFVLQRHIDFA